MLSLLKDVTITTVTTTTVTLVTIVKIEFFEFYNSLVTKIKSQNFNHKILVTQS